MKNPSIRPNHSKPEQTTNYAADTHAEFCKRCFERNGYEFCPVVKGFPDRKKCSL